MDQVEENESFVHALEDEALEVECLLLEPQNESVSVDDILCLDKKNVDKGIAMEDISCKLGGPDSSWEEEDVLTFKELDAMSYEDEMGNLLSTSGLSVQCDDYLLDVENSPCLDNDPSKRLHTGNSGSDSPMPSFSNGDRVILGISDLSAAVISMPECQKDLLDKTVCQLHGIFRHKCECKSSVEDKWVKCLTSIGSQNFVELKDDSDVMVRGMSSDKREQGMIFCFGLTSKGMSCASTIMQNDEVSQTGQRLDSLAKSSAQASDSGALLTHKRLRKPNQRYIDESSDLNSRYCRKRLKISSSTSKDNILVVRYRNHSHGGCRAGKSFSEESYGKNIQGLFVSLVQKECWNNHATVPVLNSDEAPSPAHLKDDSVVAVRSEEDSGQRKHHRMWTLLEVTKLIDGVSQFGVGRWTQIKRVMFSSSAHRTPVDLKDKWRNLLKASRVKKYCNKEDEQRKSLSWRPLPKSLLCRVSELAMIYPYPRDRKSKLSCLNLVSSSSLLPRSACGLLSLRQRTVRSKNCG